MVGRKGLLDWFVLKTNRSKSEQICTNQSIPVNKKRKSEQLGRKRGSRNKSEQIGVNPFCRPQTGGSELSRLQIPIQMPTRMFLSSGALSTKKKKFKEEIRSSCVILWKSCHSRRFATCCFPHLQFVNKFPRFWPSQTDWNRLKLIEANWKWRIECRRCQRVSLGPWKYQLMDRSSWNQRKWFHKSKESLRTLNFPR